MSDFVINTKGLKTSAEMCNLIAERDVSDSIINLITLILDEKAKQGGTSLRIQVTEKIINILKTTKNQDDIEEILMDVFLR